MVRELITRLLKDVGIDEKRWNSLIPLIDDLPEEQYSVVIAKIKELSASLTSNSNGEQLRAVLRKSLREMLSHHMAFPGTNWAMTKEHIGQLQQIYIELDPQDLVTCYTWQFSHSARFMLTRTEDRSEQQTVVESMRKQAIREIYATGGLSDILRLAQQADEPHLVGWTLGCILSLEAQEDDFLAQALQANESYLVLLSQGYIRGRLVSDASWLEAKLASPLVTNGASLQKANFYLCLPSEQHTWNLVTTAGTEVENLYWSKVGIWSHEKLSLGELEYFVESLVIHNRLTEAIDYMSALSYSKEDQLPPTFIAGVLETAISDTKSPQVHWQQLVDAIPHLLKIIEASGEIEEGRLSRLEWLFLPWLEHSEYQPKVLMKGLAEDPAFFCELLTWVFKATDEEPRHLSLEDINRARQASELLKQWQKLPGSDEQGNIDGEELLTWIAKATKLAHACGRGIIGEEQIGQMLSHSPKGTDALWPHEAVRNVIEVIASKHIERGFEIGTFNNRGVTVRAPTEGGNQEREIANNYRAYGQKFRDDWPRTSQMLKRMADNYEHYARNKDIDAELTQDLWR